MQRALSAVSRTAPIRSNVTSNPEVARGIRLAVACRRARHEARAHFSKDTLRGQVIWIDTADAAAPRAPHQALCTRLFRHAKGWTK